MNYLSNCWFDYLLDYFYYYFKNLKKKKFKDYANRGILNCSNVYASVSKPLLQQHFMENHIIQIGVSVVRGQNGGCSRDKNHRSR